MNIKTAKLTPHGVLINGSTLMPDSYSGHIRDSYNEWLDQGNEPAPLDAVDPWPSIRAERDSKINAVQIEYDRNARELRLKAIPTRSIDWMAQLDQYIQELADIPQTFKDNPDGVIWPESPVTL